MNTPGEPEIAIRKVNKTFRSRSNEAVEALRETSLDIEAKQFVAIIGPSGCGKSTLLRMIAGLECATSGSLSIRGTAITGPRRDTGLVFQTPVLLPWRTILKNVLVPAEVMRLDRKTALARAQDLLRLVGLEKFMDRYPDELSGGMRQRAAIARSLMHDPDVLLMDEPFGALDALTREVMNLELLRIWQVSSKTVVLVTHSIEEALLLADKVAIFSPRPGSIIDLVDVPLPRPRSSRTRIDPLFVELAAKLRGYFVSELH